MVRDNPKDPGELEQGTEQHARGDEGVGQGMVGQSRVERTLDELAERLSMIRANPVPTLLVAAGLAWLAISQTKEQASSSEPVPSSDEPSHASYGVDPDYDPLSGVGHVALEKSDHDIYGESYHDKSVSYGDNLEKKVSSFLNNKPLLIAAFGIAIGGFLSVVLPRLSRREEGLDKVPRHSGKHSGDLPPGGDFVDEGEVFADLPIRH